MRSPQLLFSLCVFCLLSLPLLGQSNVNKDNPDVQVILANHAAFSQAVIDGKPNLLSGFYTPDASILPPGKKILLGRTRIKEFWTPVGESTTSHHKIDPEEVLITGDFAYDYGYYSVMGPRDGSSTGMREGKYLMVWKKLPTGDWKIYLDSWNSVEK